MCPKVLSGSNGAEKDSERVDGEEQEAGLARDNGAGPSKRQKNNENVCQ